MRAMSSALTGIVPSTIRRRLHSRDEKSYCLTVLKSSWLAANCLKKREVFLMSREAARAHRQVNN